MRLAGDEVPGSVTGGVSAYLPLRTLSVLLGANDTGKTRLLRAIAAGLPPSGSEEESPCPDPPTLSVLLDASPGEWLDWWWDVKDPSDFRPMRVFGKPIALDDSEWFKLSMRVYDEVLKSHGALDGLDRDILRLRRAVGLDGDPWTLLFDALKVSRYALATPSTAPSVGHGWHPGQPADAAS